MITAKYQISRAFLCVVLFLLKSQGGFGEAASTLETPGQANEGLTLHYSQKRMLATMFEIGCEVQGSCATSNTFDGSSISYSISLQRKAEVEIQLEIGKAQRDLKFDLQTSSNAIETDIWLDESGKIVSADGSWSRTIQIGSSSTDRSLKIQIVNDGIFSQQVSLQITQGGSLAEDIVSTGARIWVIVVAVIGSLLFLALICICRRRIIRRRMMMNRLRNRYRAEQNENQPPQVVIQYQPVQYPAPIQYDNNQAPQNNNLPLAPPVELVLPKFAPESVLLSEDNFEQRFPEAQMEDFQTHFPQKTCSICLEDLNRNQKCRQLSCEHIFHSECVKLWLLNQMKKQNHANCPNCNKDMTVSMERAKQ